MTHRRMIAIGATLFALASPAMSSAYAEDLPELTAEEEAAMLTRFGAERTKQSVEWVARQMQVEDNPYCYKQTYGRGFGYPLAMDLMAGVIDIVPGGAIPKVDRARDACAGDQPPGGTCEQWGLFFYPTCDAGYEAFGCCICQSECPESRPTDCGAGCATTTEQCVADTVTMVANTVMFAVQARSVYSGYQAYKASKTAIVAGAAIGATAAQKTAAQQAATQLTQAGIKGAWSALSKIAVNRLALKLPSKAITFVVKQYSRYLYALAIKEENPEISDRLLWDIVSMDPSGIGGVVAAYTKPMCQEDPFPFDIIAEDKILAERNRMEQFKRGYLRHDNGRLAGFGIGTRTGLSPLQCSELCTQDANCKSFDYYHKLERCDLHSALAWQTPVDVDITGKNVGLVEVAKTTQSCSKCAQPDKSAGGDTCDAACRAYRATCAKACAKTSDFVQIYDKTWEERDPSGKVLAVFPTVWRDAWSVYLENSTTKQQLDLYRKQAFVTRGSEQQLSGAVLGAALPWSAGRAESDHYIRRGSGTTPTLFKTKIQGPYYCVTSQFRRPQNKGEIGTAPCDNREAQDWYFDARHQMFIDPLTMTCLTATDPHKVSNLTLRPCDFSGKAYQSWRRLLFPGSSSPKLYVTLTSARDSVDPSVSSACLWRDASAYRTADCEGAGVSTGWSLSGVSLVAWPTKDWPVAQRVAGSLSDLPPGPYRETCTELSVFLLDTRRFVQGTMLVETKKFMEGKCKTQAGDLRTTIMELPCGRAVTDDLGNLACTPLAAGLPEGSYMNSCKDISAQNGELTARCLQPGLNKYTVGLSSVKLPCDGEVINDGGVLLCRAARLDLPQGSYQETCRALTVTAGTNNPEAALAEDRVPLWLDAECSYVVNPNYGDRGRAGSTQWKRRQLALPCSGEISNNHGSVSCTGETSLDLAKKAIEEERSLVGEVKSRALCLVGGASKTSVQVKSCSGVSAPSKRWFWKPDGTLKHQATALCLDGRNKISTGATKYRAITTPCDGGEDQKWSWTSGGGLKNRRTGMCIDTWGGGMAGSAVLWTCSGDLNQNFTATPLSR